jgi:hypothetical protein
MNKPSPVIIGMLVGVGLVVLSIAFEYFYRPYIIGANIGAGILLMVGVVVFGVFGIVYLLEDHHSKK